MMLKRLLIASLLVCAACSGCEDEVPNTPPKQEDMTPKVVNRPVPTKTVVGAGTLQSKTYKTTVVVVQ